MAALIVNYFYLVVHFQTQVIKKSFSCCFWHPEHLAVNVYSPQSCCVTAKCRRKLSTQKALSCWRCRHTDVWWEGNRNKGLLMWRTPISRWPEESDLGLILFPPPPTSLLSSRKSSLLWPGEAERLGGGQAEPAGGHRDPRVCSWRTLQTSAMPPVHWVLLVCPGGHGTSPAWYFHSVRAVGRPGKVPGWRRWDTNNTTAIWNQVLTLEQSALHCFP